MNESDLILNKFRFNIGSFNFFSSLIKKNKNTKPMKKPKITYKLLNPISWLTKSDENNINIDIKNTKAPYLSNFTSEVEFLAGRVLYPTINEISPIGIFIKNIKCQLR